MATKIEKPSTKKPTGLSIDRDNYKFTFGWKINDADHGAGQKLSYKEYFDKTSTDGTKKLNKTQTSVSHDLNHAKDWEIPRTSYYPRTSKKLKKIYFEVSGRRKKYETKKKNTTIKHIPKWSDPANKSFTIEEPYAPVVTQILDENSDVTTIFSWTSNVSDNDHRIFTDYEWWTKLTSNGKSPNWSKGHIVKKSADGIDKKTGGSDIGSLEDTESGAIITWNISKGEGTVTITEDSAKVLTGVSSTSYTRSFRVRARGPAGDSAWSSEKHVYAYPKAVQQIYHNQKDINAAVGNIQTGQDLMILGNNMIISGQMSGSAARISAGVKNVNTGLTKISKAQNKLEKLSGAIMTTRKKKASGSVVKLSWDCDENNGHPIDYCEVEYCIVTPVVTRSTKSGKVTAKISCPDDGFPGTIAGRVYDSTGWSAYSFILPSHVPDNQTMFVRVNTWHDRKVNYGKIFEVNKSAADLTAPTGLSYVNFNPAKHRIEVTTPTNNCGIVGSCIVIYFRSNKKADSTEVVGLIPWENSGQGNTILTIPAIDDDDTPGLGMQTVVANYKPKQPQPNTTDFTVEDVKMSSDGIDWSAGVIPMPPTLTVDRVGTSADQVYSHWNWRWSQANAAELSWSTDTNAWQSTTEPSRYVVSGVNAPDWYISGLSPAMWHFRCRLLKQVGDTTSYGSYSKTVDVDLATDPYKPVVQADTYTVVSGDSFTLYWSFSNEDSSGPASADITFCPLVNNVPTPNDRPFREKIDFRGKYDQTIKLSTGKTKYYNAFPVGGITYLAVRTRSVTGKVSDWSEPVGITIAEKLTASITATSLTSTSVYSYSQTEDTQIDATKTYYVMTENDYEEVLNPVVEDIQDYYERIVRVVPNSLTTLPLRVTVAGNGGAGTSSIAITRVEDYVLVRPELKTDELPYNGFAGETIAVQSRTGAGEIVVEKSDLIGTLDEGEKYLITATLVDSYGQTATAKKEFEVHWAHQALMPTAVITPNIDELVTVITPEAPAGIANGDVVDIYRLSADAPELIIQGGTFGTSYVDPYPTLGEFGGHRIIFRTSNGDFITANDQLAMRDYTEEDDNTIDYFAIVIDFASEQIRLPYNVTVSNKWTKDFTEVKFLGGSVKGYWNPAVSRTSSLNTVVAIQDDENGHDLIMAMRRLANYAGVCHIRTPDGSSYSANINVNEDREERWVNRLAKFSLDVTRVNPEGFEGMTLAEWEDEEE